MQALKLALELENLTKYSNICIKYIFNIAVGITGKLDLVNKLLTARFFFKEKKSFLMQKKTSSMSLKMNRPTILI
jgi:hypothetical protein